MQASYVICINFLNFDCFYLKIRITTFKYKQHSYLYKHMSKQFVKGSLNCCLCFLCILETEVWTSYEHCSILTFPYQTQLVLPRLPVLLLVFYNLLHLVLPSSCPCQFGTLLSRQSSHSQLLSTILSQNKNFTLL